jgi:hypothetical protein
MIIPRKRTTAAPVPERIALAVAPYTPTRPLPGRIAGLMRERESQRRSPEKRTIVCSKTRLMGHGCATLTRGASVALVP